MVEYWGAADFLLDTLELPPQLEVHAPLQYNAGQIPHGVAAHLTYQTEATCVLGVPQYIIAVWTRTRSSHVAPRTDRRNNARGEVWSGNRYWPKWKPATCMCGLLQSREGRDRLCIESADKRSTHPRGRRTPRSQTVYRTDLLYWRRDKTLEEAMASQQYDTVLLPQYPVESTITIYNHAIVSSIAYKDHRLTNKYQYISWSAPPLACQSSHFDTASSYYLPELSFLSLFPISTP